MNKLYYFSFLFFLFFIECHREQLEDIMKRLTGWFVLLHAKYKENKKNMADGPVYQIPNLSLHRAANKTKHHFSVKKELNSFYKSRKFCFKEVFSTKPVREISSHFYITQFI